MALPNYGWGGGIIQWIARGARFRATQHPLTVAKGDDAENVLYVYIYIYMLNNNGIIIMKILLTMHNDNNNE